MKTIGNRLCSLCHLVTGKHIAYATPGNCEKGRAAESSHESENKMDICSGYYHYYSCDIEEGKRQTDIRRKGHRPREDEEQTVRC